MYATIRRATRALEIWPDATAASKPAATIRPAYINDPAALRRIAAELERIAFELENQKGSN